MKKNKPYCETVCRWLKDNGVIGMPGMTGQDYPALKASVHIVETFTTADSQGRKECAIAFGAIVRCMQPSMRHLAYHAIAHVSDWSFRNDLWTRAGLEPLQNSGICDWEPGGRARP